MFKGISQRFSGGCFLLVRKKEDSVLFLGTAFLVHEEGYLLTAAHLLEVDGENLMAARPQDPEEFSALSMESVAAIPLELVRTDKTHNTALLKFGKNLIIDTPDHLMGSSEAIPLGSSVLALGFPFGHQDLHNLAVQSSIISSKVLLRNKIKLFLIDRAMHDGMAGGPLVNWEDGRVIGILLGRFAPEDEGGDFVRGRSHPDFETNYSYAIPIEYGRALLEELSLDIF